MVWVCIVSVYDGVSICLAFCCLGCCSVAAGIGFVVLCRAICFGFGFGWYLVVRLVVVLLCDCWFALLIVLFLFLYDLYIFI